MGRKVSFQVQGLAPPLEVAEAEEASGAISEGSNSSHASKRIKGGEEFSMKFLVDKFYGRVLQQEPLKPFFVGVDMFKLKYQQEALMLLVFGGHELLEDELPGLSADLRLIHLHLLFEGLNLSHWQLFADIFGAVLDELVQIPEDVRQRAKAYMASTQHYFRPIEPHEWPPKVVYKGWTKRSCPFHTSFKRPVESAEDAEQDTEAAAAAAADTGAAATAAAGDGGATAEDDGEFSLPGFNSPPSAAAPAPLPTVEEEAAEEDGEAAAAAADRS
ncbi:hypothetical protein GPECTOR_9g657 [Gonium pectorale]|uniref:Uncharacterized protein n=1 Tax=Gonium pectorale TaxID=33097 RepID=A0A150GSC4_GONPE|nr:hypothetical protein GPECTOR_9g657 [Gonium pectorale]|eukprot:KXZ52612.1 hypothetical protein GPECTOR_9g657 [Gonium pectorale]